MCEECEGRRVRELIDSCFQSTPESPITSSMQVIVNLYRAFVPGFDHATKIDGWPKVSREMWKYICEKIMELDRELYRGTVMPGGAWINYGFGTGDEETGWKVDMRDCRVIVESGEEVKEG